VSVKWAHIYCRQCQRSTVLHSPAYIWQINFSLSLSLHTHCSLSSSPNLQALQLRSPTYCRTRDPQSLAPPLGTDDRRQINDTSQATISTTVSSTVGYKLYSGSARDLFLTFIILEWCQKWCQRPRIYNVLDLVLTLTVPPVTSLLIWDCTDILLSVSFLSE